MYEPNCFFRHALEKLREWGMPSVHIHFHSEKFINHHSVLEDNLSSIFDFADSANNYEISNILCSVYAGLSRAGQEIINLSGIQLDDYEDPLFKLTANIAAGFFEYRGYEDTYETVVLHQNERIWSIDDNMFFQEVGFRSNACLGSQPDVLETWRPHIAKSLSFTWNEESDEVIISSKASLIYAAERAIWPDCVGAEIRSLRHVLEITFPPPEKTNHRSIWNQQLVIDFEQKSIQFIQLEKLAVQHEFFSGIMPLEELVWLAVESRALVPISEEERADWLETGIIKRVLTMEEVIANSGIPEPKPEPEPEYEYEYEYEYEEYNYSDDLDESDDYSDERRLLNEEISDSQEAYAHSDEDGWYYHD